jgi:hypothetical protein
MNVPLFRYSREVSVKRSLYLVSPPGSKPMQKAEKIRVYTAKFTPELNLFTRFYSYISSTYILNVQSFFNLLVSFVRSKFYTFRFLYGSVL